MKHLCSFYTMVNLKMLLRIVSSFISLASPLNSGLETTTAHTKSPARSFYMM